MISLKNVSCGYSEHKVLQSIHLHLESGLHFLMGPNGSGKSTLLKTIAGHQSAISGAIEVSSKGFYFPPALEIDPALSVPDIVDIFENSETSEPLQSYLRIFKISSLLKRRVGQLSSGELQKVLLSLALATPHKILLLDEPLTHLDLESQLQFAEILHLALRDSRLLLLSTHDPYFVIRFRNSQTHLIESNLQIFSSPSETALLSPQFSNLFKVSPEIHWKDGQEPLLSLKSRS